MGPQTTAALSSLIQASLVGAFTIVTQKVSAKALYTSGRSVIRQKLMEELEEKLGPRGIVLEDVLLKVAKADDQAAYSLRRADMTSAFFSSSSFLLTLTSPSCPSLLALPPVPPRQGIKLPKLLTDAIETKAKAEQESARMEFVLSKERQEADRKRIEAEGVAAFQKIVSDGISTQLLQWKGIEATERLAESSNAKIVMVGNSAASLPVILSAASEPEAALGNVQ